MEHGAAECEALLPSAGKLGGETIEIRLQTVELDDFIHAALKAVGRQAVDAAVELKIFGDGEIVVETEPLRHIADVLAHGFRIGAHVDAFNVGLSASEGQESGEHFDYGGFAAAVGA